MASVAPPERYRFGPFELQPDNRRLLKDGATISLRPRAFDLLAALVDRAGHLVTKDE
jgi:non-specific serine/threonine protein kinase